MDRRPWSQVLGHAGAGLLGTTLMAVGAVGVGWLPPLFNVEVNPVLAGLRLSAGGPLLARIAVVFGGALLLHSWLLLGVEVLTRRLLSTRDLFRILAAWILPLVLTPPMFSRDVYSYIAQGRLFDRGLDPYTHGVAWLPGWFQLGVDPAWAETPTPYGPVFLGMQWLVVQLTPDSPWWSTVIFRLLAIAGVVLLATAAARAAQQHGIPAAPAVWLVALNPLVLMHLVSGVHNDALMIGLMMWAFVLANESRFVWAVVLLTAAAGVKPIALIALPFLLLAAIPRDANWRTRVWIWLRGGIGSMVLLAIAGAALGVGFGWIRALTTPGTVRTLLSPATALGQIIGWLGDLMGFDITDGAIEVTRLVAMAIGVLMLLALALRPVGRSPMRAAGLAFTAIILFSPVVQPWYLLWALPLIGCSGLAKPWHLRAIVTGTAFFVIFSLSEVSVVTDSKIGVNDFVSIAVAALAVAVVSLASPRERELAIGSQFAAGLSPTTDSEVSAAQAQLVRNPASVG